MFDPPNLSSTHTYLTPTGPPVAHDAEQATTTDLPAYADENPVNHTSQQGALTA
ncbi:hypothetical protein BYT27DRAFT_7193702 [Phlegmacium glaucopus]|nr:hypothetical protein BYT27DRAFT_7193702 [Phlegmacium glaucopus]